MHAARSRVSALVFAVVLAVQSLAALFVPLPANAQVAPGYDTGTRQAFGDMASAQTYCAKFKSVQLSPPIPGYGADAVVRLDSLYNSQTYNQLHSTFYVLPNSQYWNYPGAGPTFYCLYDAVMSGWKDRDNPALATVAINSNSFFQSTAATIGPTTSYADAQKICNGPVVWKLTQLTNVIAQFTPGQQYTTYYAQPNNPGWEDRTLGDRYECMSRIQSPNMQYYQLLQNQSYAAALNCVGSFTSCDPATKAAMLYYCSTHSGLCPDKIVALLKAPDAATFNALMAQTFATPTPIPANAITAPAPATPAPPPVNVPAPGYDTSTRKAFGDPDSALTYCAQHFTPGSIARIAPTGSGQTYFFYYASPSDHSTNWNNGNSAFYCLYDAVESGWKSVEGKQFTVALGGSTQAASYNGGLNALQAMDSQNAANSYCAAHYQPNDVVRRDNLVTTNNYSKTGKTYYITSHSPDYNYSGAGAYYCLHDVLAAGWVDRDTLASSASAGQAAFGGSDPKHNYDDAVKVCNGISNVAWVLDGMSHDINTISHGNTTFYAKAGEAHWLEKQQGYDNHFSCVAQLPAPNMDVVAYESARVASELPNCVSAFGTCSDSKRIELLGMCLNRKLTCTQQQVVLLQAKDSRNFTDAHDPQAGVGDCTKAYGTCQNVVVQFLSDECTNNKISCTSLQRQLLNATSQTAFNQLLNPPASGGLAGTIGGVTSGLVGGLTGAASSLHLDQVFNFAQGSSTFTTYTMVEKKAGKMIGIVLDITKAGVISNDGSTFTMHLPNGMSLIGHDGGSLISQDGGSVIASGRGNIITQDGATIITQDGATLITQDGGSLVARAVLAMIAQDPSAFIGHNGSALLGPGGASGLVSSSGSMTGTSASDSLLTENGSGVINGTGSGIVSFPMGAGASFGIRSFGEASDVDVYRTFQAAMSACGDMGGEKLSQVKTAFALRNIPHSYTLLTDVPPQRWSSLQIRGYVCAAKAASAAPPWRHVPNP